MTSNRRVMLCFSLLLIGSFFGSALAIHHAERVRPQATLEETLFITSPQALQRMSVGYSGLMADIYWTRAVQYFGNKQIIKAKRFDLLLPLLTLTTSLDPHLLEAYEFGSTFLAQQPPSGAGMPDAAIEYVQKGIENNPLAWHLYTDKAFIYYFEKKDYVAAGKTMLEGSQVPGAHPFMKTVAAVLIQRGGELETARILWQSVLASTKDNAVQDNAVKHLRALDVDETVPKLEALARLYRQRAGQTPENFSDLVRAGLLRGVPLDPIGNPYQLFPDGHVEAQDTIDLPFIVKGLPPGQMPTLFDYSKSKK
jgi:hypothetical protein